MSTVFFILARCSIILLILYKCLVPKRDNKSTNQKYDTKWKIITRLRVRRFGGLSQQVKVFIKDMIKKKKKKNLKTIQILSVASTLWLHHHYSHSAFLPPNFPLNPNSFLRYCFVMGSSFVAHVLCLLWFFATTFNFFLKAESNVSCNEKDKQALLNFKKGLSDPFGLLST